MNPEDELCLWIGRVARAHVQLDMALRSVHQTLATPGLGVHLTNRITSTSILVDDCRSMLASALLDTRVQQAAEATLQAAKDANVVRNRVVHDMWLRDVALDDDEPPQWMVHRNVKGQLHPVEADAPRDVTFVAQATEQLARAGLRARAITWALWEVLPYFQGAMGPVPDGVGHDEDSRGELASWVAVMENRFSLHSDGSFNPWPEFDR